MFLSVCLSYNNSIVLKDILQTIEQRQLIMKVIVQSERFYYIIYILV